MKFQLIFNLQSQLKFQLFVGQTCKPYYVSISTANNIGHLKFNVRLQPCGKISWQSSVRSGSDRAISRNE